MAAALGVEHPAALVADRPPALVERQPVDRDPRVADRAQQQAGLELLAIAGVLGAQGAVTLDQLVAADHHPLDLAIAPDLDRGAEEAEHDPLALALGLAPGELGEDL